MTVWLAITCSLRGLITTAPWLEDLRARHQQRHRDSRRAAPTKAMMRTRLRIICSSAVTPKISFSVVGLAPGSGKALPDFGMFMAYPVRSGLLCNSSTTPIRSVPLKHPPL